MVTYGKRGCGLLTDLVTARLDGEKEYAVKKPLNAPFLLLFTAGYEQCGCGFLTLL